MQFYFEMIQGQAYLLTSRTVRKPSLDDEQISTEYIFKEDLGGLYYLSVTGLTDCLFTIVPVVTR